MPDQDLRAAVSYQKLPGTLCLSASQVRWDPSSLSNAASALAIPLSGITGLSVTKPGAASVALQLVLAPGTPGAAGKSKVMLHFTPNAAKPEAAALVRDQVKERLTPIVAANRDRSEQATASPAVPAAAASTSKVTLNDERRPAAAAKTELELRYRVLMAHPALAALHRELVMTQALPDAEFWSHPTRTALLNAERAAAQQRAGRNARIADPRPRTDERGEMRVEVTPQLKRDLFEQYPVVRRAWDENVPLIMDEATFWTRYFQSRLYHRLRTSARSAANEHIFKDDDVFDKYLEAGEDDDIEPRRQHTAHEALLDLGATAEDHGETGNTADWTMKAGGSRSALPLMRRFNEHSASLLDDALGTQDELEARRKRRKTGVDQDYGAPNRYWDSIVMEDLVEERNDRAVPLDMSKQRGLFESRAGAGGGGIGESATDEHRTDILAATAEALPSWTFSLGSFVPQGTAGAMKVMLHNIRSRGAARAGTKNNLLSDTLHKAVTTHQAAVNEFLRQYWAAIAHEPERAKRMLDSIEKLEDRKAELEQEAEKDTPGEGRQRIQMILAPTERAVRRALRIGITNATAQ